MERGGEAPLLHMDLHRGVLVGADDHHHRGVRTLPQDPAGQTDRRVLRAVRGLHPHPPHPHRGQQLRGLLQEPAVAERGRAEEEGEDDAAGGREEPGGEAAAAEDHGQHHRRPRHHKHAGSRQVGRRQGEVGADRVGYPSPESIKQFRMKNYPYPFRK